MLIILNKKYILFIITAPCIAAMDFPTYKQWVLTNINVDTECDIMGVNALHILLQVRSNYY